MAHYRDIYRGLTVCVTGGAGFIGSHLVDALVDLGAKVRVLDDFSNGRDENLEDARRAISKGVDRPNREAGPLGMPTLTVVRGSITDDAALDEALAGCEVVFHQAALGSVPQSIEEPERFHAVNIGGTLKVMDAVRRHKVRRVVYAASSSAYGSSPKLPKVETMCPDPLSPYAATKLAGEHIMRSWATCYGIETMSLRYFNIFGPRQREDSPYAAVVPLFAKALREGTPAVINGDGTVTRDFTYVANAVHANLLAGAVANNTPAKWVGPPTWPKAASRPGGEVVNIACGVKYSLLQLLEAMAQTLGKKAEVKFMPPRIGDIRESVADITAAETLLGYKVIVPFEEGLKYTVGCDRVSAWSLRHT